MRTTIDIDEELHSAAQAEARRTRTSVSSIVNDALAKRFRPVPPVDVDSLTGLGVVRIGRPVTTDDVAEVLDD